MAVEYANIFRTLNYMMESRARREDAKTEASLRALQMAKEEERFDKELAFKREQLGLQQEELLAKKEERFIDRAKGLAQVALSNWGSEAKVVWNTTFNDWYNSFLDKDGAISDSKKKEMIKSLTGNGDFVFTDTATGKPITMDIAAADNLITQMRVVDKLIKGGSSATGELDILYGQWEQATGTALTNYNDGKQFRDGYNRLTKELQQVELGDFDFNILQDQISGLKDIILDESLLGEDESNILQPDKSKEVTLDSVLNTLDAESMMQFINQDSNELNILARKQQIVKGIPYLNEWAVKIDEMTVPYGADKKTQWDAVRGQMSILNSEIQKSKNALKELNKEIQQEVNQHNRYIDYNESLGLTSDMSNENIYGPEMQEQHNLEKLLIETTLEVLENKKQEMQPVYNKLWRGW
jgi:hypothetical protein